MLHSPLPLLQHAREHGYAIPAFNFYNLETIKAVLEAAEEARSPIIVQTSEGAVTYAGLSFLINLAKSAAESSIPVVLHFDHGKDLTLLKKAIESGYSSVMFDGSSLPRNENIQKTRQVVRWARMHGVAVEAEIGRIQGVEDLVSVSARDAVLTVPEEAVRFVKETECDFLAVAIGTAHGGYKFKDATHLDLDRLKKIAAIVKEPLVLHGASGVREDVLHLAQKYGATIGEMRGVLDEDLTKAVKLGVAKINIDTDLRLAFSAGIREAVADMPKVIDPRELFGPAIQLMKETAKQKMTLFGSTGKAS